MHQGCRKMLWIAATAVWQWRCTGKNVWSQKIFIFTPWRVVGNSERKGLLRPKFLKESVKQNWTLQIRGWWGGSGCGGGEGNKSPKNSHEGVWIFAGTTTPFPKTNWKYDNKFSYLVNCFNPTKYIWKNLENSCRIYYLSDPGLLKALPQPSWSQM